MMNIIFINLAVEDSLSESILRTILRQSNRPYEVGTCFSRGGYGYLKDKIIGFNNAAKGTPFIILTDLNTYECPPVLMREWLPDLMHPNLLFRVAVREVEAWVLAHCVAFAKFLGIREELIPVNVDTIKDPKRFLIDLARKSPRRDLRQDIVPPPGSTRQQGPDYNGRLIFFVENFWDAMEAKNHSPSLQRAINAVTKFKPRLGTRRKTKNSSAK